MAGFITRFIGKKMKKNLFVSALAILLLIAAGCSGKPSNSYDLDAPSWFINTVWENDKGETLRITETDIFIPDGPEEGLITALKALGGSMTTSANASRYEIHVYATRTEQGTGSATIDISYIFELDKTGESLAYHEEGVWIYNLEGQASHEIPADETPVIYKKTGTIKPPEEGLFHIPSWLADKTWRNTDQAASPNIVIATNNDLLMGDEESIAGTTTISAQISTADEWKQGNDDSSYWISYSFSTPGSGGMEAKMTFEPINSSSFRLILDGTSYFPRQEDIPIYDQHIFILN